MKLSATILMLSSAMSMTNAFAPSTQIRPPTKLSGYIEADSVDEELDPKLGGLGLANDNAIMISGDVDKKGMAIAKDMKHFKQVIKTDVSKIGGKVLCKGEGAELYQDPGMSTDKIITLAPISAVEKALQSVDSADKNGNIFVTFSGGGDLMVHEVLEGVQNMVEGLALKSKVSFRSLCSPSFPLEKCGVAVVSLDDKSDGNIYFNEGEWYTLSEDDFVDFE